MNELFEKGWRLSKDQKNRLSTLLDLAGSERENFFENVEYQIRNLPLPKGNKKPFDTQLSRKISKKAEELAGLISQLPPFEKEMVDEATSETVQTLTTLSVVKKGDDKQSNTYKRNVLKLDRDTEIKLHRNYSVADIDKVPIDDDAKELSQFGNIEFGRELESYTKSIITVYSQGEPPTFQLVKIRKESAPSELNIDVQTIANTHVNKVLKAVAEKANDFAKEYKNYGKLDLITESLAIAFGGICLVDGKTGAPLKPQRKIVASDDSLFVKYLAIVLEDMMKEYSDPEVALRKSVSRAKWYEMRKRQNKDKI